MTSFQMRILWTLACSVGFDVGPVGRRLETPQVDELNFDHARSILSKDTGEDQRSLLLFVRVQTLFQSIDGVLDGSKFDIELSSSQRLYAASTF